MADAIASLPRRGAGKLLADPLGKGIHPLLTAEKVFDQLCTRL
jgi:hypothetical protein